MNLLRDTEYDPDDQNEGSPYDRLLDRLVPTSLIDTPSFMFL
jgi:hypothetical protein